MRADLLKQTQQLEASRASARTLFEATTNQVRTLENKLELEHTLQQNLFRDTEARLRRQDVRLNRITAAGFILVLAAVAGAVIFWLVRLSFPQLGQDGGRGPERSGQLRSSPDGGPPRRVGVALVLRHPAGIRSAWMATTVD